MQEEIAVLGSALPWAVETVLTHAMASWRCDVGWDRTSAWKKEIGLAKGWRCISVRCRAER
jgi:hypothetical protein